MVNSWREEQILKKKSEYSVEQIAFAGTGSLNLLKRYTTAGTLESAAYFQTGVGNCPQCPTKQYTEAQNGTILDSYRTHCLISN